MTSYDSHWTVPTAWSLLRDGDFDLREFQPLMEHVNYFGLVCISEDGKFTYLPDKPREVQRNCPNRYIYYYPLAPAVLSAPLAWGVERALEAVHFVLTAVDKRIFPSRPPRAAVADFLLANRLAFERLIASLFVALATCLVFLLCAEELPWTWSAGLALTFAFATPAWSIGSRGLWQHTLSMPLLAGTLWVLSTARRRPGLVPWAGLFSMTAYFVRPTNLLSLAAFSAYVLYFHRRQLVAWLAAMIPPAAVFGGINHSIYGALLPPYSNPERATTLLTIHTQYGEALLANLISPGRGLFVFSPVVALGGLAEITPEPDRQLRWLRLCVLAVIVIHWILLSSVVIWWAGHCFGPRFFADLAPFMVFLLIPAAQKIREGSRPLAALGAILLLCSVFVHSQGALTKAAMDWNHKPVDIDRSPWRVWDWSHTSFLASVQGSAPEQKR